MTLHTLDELQRQYDLYTAQIAALDSEIAKEPIEAQRQSLMVRRFNLAKERETIAADLALQKDQHEGERHSGNPAPLERRVSTLERDVRLMWGIIKPSPRQMTAKLIFWGLLVVLWSMWMLGETRNWLLTNPAQAIVISVALGGAALIVRWLPEDTRHD